MEQLYYQQINSLLSTYPEEKQEPMRRLIDECFADVTVYFAFTDALSVISHKYGLNSEIPLAYHSPEHTLGVILEVVNYVVSDTDMLLGIDEAKLLIIAASYHDVIQRNTQVGENERKSAQYAIDRLSGLLSENQLKAISLLILSTTTIIHPEYGFDRPYMPVEEILWGNSDDDSYSIGIMADYLADADVANVGKKNFWQTTLNIATEFGMLTQELFKAFLLQQHVILENFEFYSKVAANSNTLVGKNDLRLQDYISRGNISIESYVQEFLQ